MEERAVGAEKTASEAETVLFIITFRISTAKSRIRSGSDPRFGSPQRATRAEKRASQSEEVEL